MATPKLKNPKRALTPSEVRKLPPKERDAILSAAAAVAEEFYRNDPELTAFETYGPGDLYGESANDETAPR